MTQQTTTEKLGPLEIEALRTRLSAAGFEFRDLAHAHFQARSDGATISAYRSGKVVFQGTKAGAWSTGSPLPKSRKKKTGRVSAAELEVGGGRAAALQRAYEKLPTPRPQSWIGIDEAGKGDYFGALVTAAVRVQHSDLEWLAELGIGDSKGLSDGFIRKLAPTLKEALPNHVIVLKPAKYNELYARMKNLNKLLAWCHAAAAEGVLEADDAELILSDQFAKNDIVKRSLKERGATKRFVQRTRAEDDAAVACASILARDAFVRSMRYLEKDFGVKLHLGAGAPVLAAGRRVVRDHGPGILRDLAKLHFKTTQKIT